MKKALIVLAAVAFIASGDFTDDFESYSPGDLLEDSPNWDREPAGGYARITQQGSNKAAEALFPDSAFIGYVCEAAGLWADGSVEMDFSPEGVGSFSNVFSRMSITNGESYAAGITVVFGSFTYAYMAYVNAAGDYELLYYDLGPTVTPGSWANVKLHTEGTDPVTLTLFINGENAAKVFDYTHLLTEGISGFALFYQEDPPTILADNFQVILNQQSLGTTTLGALKALFR